MRQLGPGDLVGEIGVLVSETATADVRALQDMQLLQVIFEPRNPAPNPKIRNQKPQTQALSPKP